MRARPKSELINGDIVYCIHQKTLGTILENQPEHKRAKIQIKGPTNQVYSTFYHYDNFQSLDK